MCHYCGYRNSMSARSGLDSSMPSGGREIAVAKPSEVSPKMPSPCYLMVVRGGHEPRLVGSTDIFDEWSNNFAPGRAGNSA